MLHLDLTVSSAVEPAAQRRRALRLGASVVYDRLELVDEPLYVFADPAGQPYRIFLVPA